jgi:hypothetical protein
MPHRSTVRARRRPREVGADGGGVDEAGAGEGPEGERSMNGRKITGAQRIPPPPPPTPVEIPAPPENPPGIPDPEEDICIRGWEVWEIQRKKRR